LLNQSSAIIELHYLPCTAYLAVWDFYDTILIESKESFIKQTYRNRTRILSANKVESLIVPVEKGNRNIPIQEIRIDRNQHWAKKHWKSIQSAYGNAPFFEYYAEDLKKILFKKHRFLFDLNLEFLTRILELLSIEKEISFSQQFIRGYDNKIADLRSRIHPKKSLSSLIFYHPIEYIQVFGKQFVENLSVIDLIFNEGPNSMNKINETLIKG
jgi:hypothetical protein